MPLTALQCLTGGDALTNVLAEFGLVCQSLNQEVTEHGLHTALYKCVTMANLQNGGKYLHIWHIQQSLTKTECQTLHAVS